MRNILSVRLLILCLITLYVIGCATISSPQGGPKDSIPPRVKLATPAPYSTNFSGKKAQIDFDEFVTLKDQSSLFFVSPQMAKKPIISYKGKSVVVEFQDTLVPDQTYRLDFGACIVDNNEGNRLTDYSLTFATGDRVDSLVMVGQVLDAQTRDTIAGAYIPFYALERDSTYFEQGLDSTIVKNNAEALFRTDSSGYFVADILKGKDYRVYSMLDYNGNQLYEAGVDYVAYSDEVFNPLELPGFGFGYDSLRKRMFIDSLQVVFELFKENPPKRQRLGETTRPQRGEFLFAFDVKDAIVDSLVFDSIPQEWIIEERSAKGDSLTFWLAPPTKAEFDSIRDTLSVSYVYFEDDSVFQAYSVRDTVKLTYKEPEPELSEAEKDMLKEKEAQEKRKAKEEERKKERKEKEARKNKRKKDKDLEEEATSDSTTLAADSTLVADSTLMPSDSTVMDSLPAEKPKNPFEFKLELSGDLNPDSDLRMTFGYPLREIDSTGIHLIQTTTEKVKGGRRDEEGSTKEIKDTIQLSIVKEGLRTLRLNAEWLDAAAYELVIRDSVFTDIAWRTNDSITQSFKTLDPEKFTTFVIAMNGSAADSTATASGDTTSYIVEIVSIDPKLTTRGPAEGADKISQKVIATRTGVKVGDKVVFRFIKPEKYYFRITEDKDGDGLWTTGSMRERTAPERVRLITSSNGRPKAIEGKENWEIEEPVDMSTLFPPVKKVEIPLPEAKPETIAEEVEEIEDVAEVVAEEITDVVEEEATQQPEN